MPRGVKGSGPKKEEPPAEVEVVGTADNPDAEPGMHLPEEHQFPPVDEDKVREEFNEHVKALVQNFVQQEVAGLEERIRDMEMLIGSELNQRAQAKPQVADEAEPYVPGYGGVEDYSPAHQGGDGTPWYQP